MKLLRREKRTPTTWPGKTLARVWPGQILVEGKKVQCGPAATGKVHTGFYPTARLPSVNPGPTCKTKFWLWSDGKTVPEFHLSSVSFSFQFGQARLHLWGPASFLPLGGLFWYGTITAGSAASPDRAPRIPLRYNACLGPFAA